MKDYSLSFYIKVASTLFTCWPIMLHAQETLNQDTLQLNEVEVYGFAINFHLIKLQGVLVNEFLCR